MVIETVLMSVCQVETVTDSETESKGLPQFHSIGIQVEDHKRYVAQTKQVFGFFFPHVITAMVVKN